MAEINHNVLSRNIKIHMSVIPGYKMSNCGLILIRAFNKKCSLIFCYIETTMWGPVIYSECYTLLFTQLNCSKHIFFKTVGIQGLNVVLLYFLKN
jgi:hypothetical protein